MPDGRYLVPQRGCAQYHVRKTNFCLDGPPFALTQSTELAVFSCGSTVAQAAVGPVTLTRQTSGSHMAKWLRCKSLQQPSTVTKSPQIGQRRVQDRDLAHDDQSLTVLFLDSNSRSQAPPTYRTDTAAAAAAASSVVLASGLDPEAAREAFLAVRRYDAGKEAEEPTPAAVRAARVWRETSRAGAKL